MKRLLLLLSLFFIVNTIYSHTVINKGWCGGSYTIEGNNGAHNGYIEVTVYTNSNMNTVIPQSGGTAPYYTITYQLSNSGSKTFTVPQLNKNIPVYVKVVWFNINHYLDPWQGNNNATTPITTNSNTLSGCSVLAIKTIEIVDAKKDGNNTIITFRGESTSDNEKVTLNFILPDGTIKHISILFWTKLYPTDLWEIKINNITTSVITVKKI